MTDKRIDMEDLRYLQDDQPLETEKGRIFNFMFKKYKLQRIKFELNSKNVWIFPLSKEERNFFYNYTEPNHKFLKLISQEEV